MNNYIILNKRKYIKRVHNILDKYNMEKTFKNFRTEIWENDDIQISIDRTIIRVLIFKSKDISYYNEFFRGKQCEKEIYDEITQHLINVFKGSKLIEYMKRIPQREKKLHVR